MGISLQRLRVVLLVWPLWPSGLGALGVGTLEVECAAVSNTLNGTPSKRSNMFLYSWSWSGPMVR